MPGTIIVLARSVYSASTAGLYYNYMEAEVLFILVDLVYCRDNHHNVYRPRSARTGLEVLTSLCVRVSGGIWTTPSTAGGCNRSRFGFIFQAMAAFALAPAAPIPTLVFCLHWYSSNSSSNAKG